jgi:CubicO group peptidase (beta-lactamase class C family)
LKDIVSGSHASLYTAKNKLVPLYSLATYPDGGLRSTPNDLLNYMQEAIKGYTGKGTLLAPTSYKQLFSKQFTDAATPMDVDPKEPNTGIFWMFRKNGEIGHTGSDPGVTVIFFFNPQTARGRIFITNTELDQSSKASAFSKIWALLGSLE